MWTRKVATAQWVASYEYLLDYTDDRGETLLSGVRKVGHAGVDAVVLGRFGYAPLGPRLGRSESELVEPVDLETEWLATFDAPLDVGFVDYPGPRWLLELDPYDSWGEVQDDDFDLGLPQGAMAVLGGGYSYTRSVTGYQDLWVGDDWAARLSADPTSYPAFEVSTTDTYTRLGDADADGLTDLLGAWWYDQSEDGEIRFERRLSDRTWALSAGDGTLYTAGEDSLPAALAPAHDVEIENRADGGRHPRRGLDALDAFTEDGLTVTVARRLLVDIDGDGLADLVEVADASQFATPDEGLPPFLPDGLFEWRVSYGTPTGTFADADDVEAPLPYPQIEFALREQCIMKYDDFNGDGLPEQQLVGALERPWHASAVELLDLDGDGWSDLVVHSKNAVQWRDGHDKREGVVSTAADITVYRHSGVRGGGWLEGVPMPAGVAGAMNSWAWFVGVIDEVKQLDELRALGLDLAEVHLPDGSTYEQATMPCRFETIYQVRGFADLNGDGLRDFVLTEGEGVPAGSWHVWWGMVDPVGESVQFADQPSAWVVPPEVRGLRRTHEAFDDMPEDAIPGAESPPRSLASIECMDGRVWLPPVDGEGGPGELEWGGDGWSDHHTDRFDETTEILGGADDAVVDDDEIPGPEDCETTSIAVVDIYDAGLTRLELALMDVDGDGRMDLIESWPTVSVVVGGVDAEGLRWWRNLGGGFSDEQCTAEGCYDIRELGGGLHLTATVTETHGGFAPWSETARTDLKVVRDLNQDGVPDLADLSAGFVAYGEHRGAGRLISIDNDLGGETTVAYAPASSLAPAGDPHGLVDVHDNVRQDVVTSIETWDRVTGSGARTDHVFTDRVVEHGRTLGFQHRTTTTWEPDLDFTVTAGTFDVELDQDGEVAWYERSRVSSDYTLHRDFALPLHRTWSTDRALMTMEELGGTEAEIAGRFEQSWIWLDLDDDSERSCADVEGLVRCRLDTRVVTDRGEKGLGRAVEFFYDYDPDTGLLLWVEQHDPATLESLVTDIEWESPDQGRRYLPSSKSVHGWDARREQDGWLARHGWSYDDLGRMTQQVVCADPFDSAGCADSIVWMFDRHDRGQVRDLAGPAGDSFWTTGWRFGGVYPGRRHDAVGLEGYTFVDDHGRPWRTRDAAGVGQETLYDGLGRPVEQRVRGVGGTWTTVATTAYHEWPIVDSEATLRAVEKVTYDEHGPLGSTFEVLDGFGRARQTWAENADGTGWVVADTFTDVFGGERATTVPHVVSTPPASLADVWSATSPGLLTWTDTHRGGRSIPMPSARSSISSFLLALRASPPGTGAPT